MFRRASPEHSSLPLQLQLTHPRWAVAVSWAAVVLAWSSLALCGYWQGVPVWAVLLLGALIFLVHHLLQQRQQRWLERHYLCFQQSPSTLMAVPQSFWGTFSKNTGQSTLAPVTLQQHWTHIFGLTLRLNLHNHPHNKPEVVTVTLWRSRLSAQTYRRLNIWAAWQAARCTPSSKGETA